MKINTNKVKTYVGFAVKSRKIRNGVDDILKLKNADLIMVSDSLAESGMKKVLIPKSFCTKKKARIDNGILISKDI